MNTRILAFAGQKQSGKTTSSNFIHGYQLRAHHIVDNFAITDQGELIVDTLLVDAEGKEESNKALLSVNRSDLEFSEWASYNMWPYVKSYSFAAPLKEIICGLFEVPTHQVYGTNIEKNTKTMYRWQDMPGVITDLKASKTSAIKKLINDGVLMYHKPGKMSGRELMQFFGTDVCRKIHEDIWQNRLMKDISIEGSLLAVVDDCRFPNEAESIQNSGGKVIHLTRNNQKASHASENSLKSYDHFDAEIDNQNMTIHETSLEIISILDDWGWLAKEVIKKQEEIDNRIVGGIRQIKEEAVI